MKKALILGVGGQDGSYLAEILLSKDYEVHGLYRRSSVDNLQRVKHLLSNLILHQGDLCDPLCIHSLINKLSIEDPLRFFEIYNLADQDHVGSSFETPLISSHLTYGGVAILLECLKNKANIKFFQPVSATMFEGSIPPQDENTPLTPNSPYACAKAGAYLLCKHYRKRYNLFVSCGIMFNHDSPRRGKGYLLQNIVDQVLELKLGTRNTLDFYDVDAKVDIGYAKEYMLAAWQMLQLDKPDDFVISSGYATPIRECIDIALYALQLQECNNYIEYAKREKCVSSRYLLGNHNKAHKVFGFNPLKRADTLIKMIIEHRLSIIEHKPNI